MSSTDMFPSAKYRKIPTKIVLESDPKPQGFVGSVHVVSLWKKQATPSLLFPEKNVSSEDVFSNIDTTDDAIFWKTLVSGSSQKTPSIEQQMATIKTLKKEYSEQFEARSTSSGFFRNFKTWW